MITLTELLNTKSHKLGGLIFKSGDFLTVKRHLKSLVIEASLTELEQIINVFNDNEYFAFLEDFILDGNVAVMDESAYWDFID